MRFSSLLSISLVVLGCTVRNPPLPPSDAGNDAFARDAGLVRDTGLALDGGTDAASVNDAGSDAAASDDAATTGDAGRDGGSDGGSDGGADAGTDAGTDAGADAGTDAGASLPGVLNETGMAAEADYCILQFPATTTTTVGTPSVTIYGRVYEAGRTDTTVGSAAPGILAELGYGPSGTDPRTSSAWTFHAATFNVETGTGGNDDEYQGTLTISSVGTYAFTYRFSFDGGANVTYCDLDGAGSNTGFDFSAVQLGAITVN